MTGIFANTVLGEHYTVSKSTGSISVAEIVALALAAIIYFLGKRFIANDTYRFAIALAIIFIFVMVD